jgi:hypothetical protein
MLAARFPSSFAVALLAHASGIVAALLFFHGSQARELIAPPTPEELVVITEEPASESPPPTVSAPTAIAGVLSGATRGVFARAMSTGASVVASPEAASIGGAPAALADPTAPAGSWSVSLVRDDAPKLDWSRAYAPDSAPRENAATASVRAELSRRDRAIGMSVGAPLLALTRDVVRRSRAPTSGRARFEFRTDSAGVVASVNVVDASASREAWNEAAQTLAREARTRTLAVPPNTRGVAVTIEVASSMKTASGIDRGETSVSIASPVATGVAKKSRADQPLRFGVVIGPNQIDITMHLGPGDAAHDATSADQRVVSAQIVDERAL